jgi:CXCXC repeat
VYERITEGKDKKFNNENCSCVTFK